MSADVPDHPGVRRSRRRLQAEVYIEAEGRRLPVELLDVSLSGARIRPPADWPPPRGAFRLELHIANEDPVSLPASVVRERAEDIALRFADLGPRLASQLEFLLERDGRLLQEIEATE
ncbi:PilZ domain-containing protein [Pseudomarimonas salicorniae]|uniref:PilZ domain-containing protein n=1 Tax=Pseudomarimonas salicorniae TaxID=2933270 RepID=A0ABT0GFQ6_9GAMM|nr:PilZ domain-containing protein [Lysobacter sp. CAU 1642]MCK7593376.1 PilZ domain-containing protein [Lysobacter sp. CAU 1642]